MARLPANCLQTLMAARIAVIKPSALGDIVQCLPLLPVLRSRFPQASITWVVQRELQDLVMGHPALDDVVCSERRPNWSTAWRLLTTLRQRRFDLVFDLQGLLRTGVMTAATGAAVRVGLETAREGSDWTTNVTVPDTSRAMPAYARYWRVAEALGCGDHLRQVQITVPESVAADVERTLNSLPRPIVAIQAGARWETKRWPVAHYADLAARAMAEWGGSVVLVGSGGERIDCELLAADLEQRWPGTPLVNLAGRTSLKALAATLSRVDYVISNDSGPLHLAAELGTPCLGLFTCTSPTRSGPPPERHVLIATQVPCAAGYHKRCPHRGDDHLACHRELTVDRAWQALQRLIPKAKTRRAAA